MPRLRLLLVFSLLALAGAFVTTLFVFFPSGSSYTALKKARIIQGQDEWILQYDITNEGDRDAKYTIQVSVGGTMYQDSATIKAGKTYTYIRHLSTNKLREGRVDFHVYEEGKSEPIVEDAYYVDPAK